MAWGIASENNIEADGVANQSSPHEATSKPDVATHSFTCQNGECQDGYQLTNEAEPVHPFEHI